MPLPKILQDNLALPVIGAPMFLVSHPELVIAQCQAGIAGSFPTLLRPERTVPHWRPRPGRRPCTCSRYRAAPRPSGCGQPTC